MHICIAELTIMAKNPRPQIINVSKTTCINAINEIRFSMLLENDIILLCLSINILNKDTVDL